VDKKQKISLLTIIVLTGFVVAVIYHYILGQFLHLDFPFNTFLYDPHRRFDDFTGMQKALSFGIFDPFVNNNANGGWLAYYPFGILIPFLFRQINNVFLALILFLLISITYYSIYNFKNIQKCFESNQKKIMLRSFFIIFFLSYPFLIWLDRANLESFIFIFISLSIVLFQKKKYLSSALVLSMPIAMKAYPFILLALFLKEKKFKETFYCIISVLLLTLISLLLMKGNMLTNLSYINTNINNILKVFCINNLGFCWSTPFLSVIKFIIYQINGCYKYVSLFPLTFLFYKYTPALIQLATQVLNIYLASAAFIGIGVAYYVIFIEKVFWKQVALLIIYSLLFSPLTQDYRLIQLYIPLGLFITSEDKSKFDLWYTILFGLMIIPKHYVYFLTFDPYPYTISSILQPLIMLSLFTLIIAEPFIYKRFVENKIISTNL